MANQINGAGKLAGGTLLILFTILPVLLLVGFWPNKLPKEGQCSLYAAHIFRVQLNDSSLCSGLQAAAGNDKDSTEIDIDSASVPDTIQVEDSVPAMQVETNAGKASLATGLLIDLNTLILLLVALGGFMGSMIHIASSFTKYVGADEYKNTWLLWYVIKPFSAAALAIAGYVAFRGGLLNYGDTVSINLYGVITLAVLTGLFTDTATEKLKAIFDTVFSPKSLPDPLPQGSSVVAAAPAITGINLVQIERKQENEIMLTGTRLGNKLLQATINTEPVAITTQTDDEIIIRYTVPFTQAEATTFELLITMDGQELYKTILPAGNQE